MYKENILNFSEVLDKMRVCDFEGVICGSNIDFKAEREVLYTLGSDNQWYVMDTVAEDAINLLFSIQ